MQRVETRPWNEARIAEALVRSVFNRAVLAVPNCNWTGSECDLLVVEPRSLRIIDVEIKISRADLRQDLAKDKWWVTRPWSRRRALPVRREWPQHAWKHYYVVPAAIWTDELYAAIPEASGVLALDSRYRFHVLRKALPNRKALPISAADAIDIARLA